MSQNINVLLVSASSMKLNDLEDALMDQGGINSQRKLLTNKSDNHLNGSQHPDVVVFEVNENWDAEFDALQDLTASLPNLPFIVIGDESNPVMMRQAMKAGARDFFTHPVMEAELLDSIRLIGRDVQMSRRSGMGTVSVIINGKGGCGGSLITSSLATTLVGQHGRKKNGAGNDTAVVVVDLDLQFGSMPVYFDLPSSDTLMRAINSGGSMDQMTLDGLMQTHASGVRLLSHTSESLIQSSDVRADDVVALVEQLARHHDHVLIDMPRCLESVGVAVLSVAEKVLIPTRQSVACLRDTMQLITLLADIGLTKSVLHVIVNQFDKKSEIRLHDVRETFEGIEVSVVPEDCKHVDYAINNGVPVPVKWPRAPLSKAMLELKTQVWPVVEQVERKGFFGRG